MDSPHFPWQLSSSQLSDQLQSNSELGLSQKEAHHRLEKFGLNQLPEKKGSSAWRILFGQFTSLLIWLLIIAAVIAGFLGEAVDAWTIGAIVLLNAALGFFQEYRAERSLEALKKLSSHKANVIRDGKRESIEATQLVPGDLLILEAGDLVPADGRVISAYQFTLNEASLTGESVPVQKSTELLEGSTALADRKNMVFRGTTVAAGRAMVLLTETGLHTEIGKIASLLQKGKKESTPLQKQLEILGRKLVWICLVVVAIVFILGMVQGIAWIEMLLTSLSLAVAAVPEGLPAIVTIALSIGVQRMAKRNALIRRLSSVETLGCTSVICSDKTGTLTQNDMVVTHIWANGKIFEITNRTSEKETEVRFSLEIATLCNYAEIEQKKKKWQVKGDPTEGALLIAANQIGLDKHTLEKKYPNLNEIPFDSQRKMMSILRQVEGQERLFVKGAPDVVLAHSKQVWKDEKEVSLSSQEIEAANESFANQGLRVIGVAFKNQQKGQKIEEEGLTFVGLIAMRDPPREEAKEAIQKCKDAHIRPVMLTGDHKNTAVAIARELGMMTEENLAVSGQELDQMNEKTLQEQVKKISVFARITAEHKLRIVRAFKACHKVTAMTGDGVNDAPAVQEADIGLSMGITGTDVTKEASDMIILDDNFATIVNAVEEGRAIYDNIVKFVSYLLSSNIAEILVIFISMFFGFTAEGQPFVALLPVQLLWINLITDGGPAIALALDPIDPRAMKQKPRSKNAKILSGRFFLFLFSISVLVTIGALIACFYGMSTSVEKAQTMTLTSLIIFELIRVQMVRAEYRLTWASNLWLLFALGSSFLLQLLILYVPSLQIVFGTVPLNGVDWLVILGTAFALWWLGRGVAFLFYHKKEN